MFGTKISKTEDIFSNFYDFRNYPQTKLFTEQG